MCSHRTAGPILTAAARARACKTNAGCKRDEAHPRCSEARCSCRYTLTHRPGSHYSLATLQRDQHRQLLPDGTACVLRPKGGVLHQVFFR